jgi:hypothetical protein
MKSSLAAAVGSAVLLAAGVSVGHAATPPATNAGAAAARPSPAVDMPLQMEGHMKTMQALHDRMQSAGTPEERRKLAQDQQAEMQACLAMMNHGIEGGGMGAQGGAMAGRRGKPGAGDAPMPMMHMRMDMMQMMMQTMVDQRELQAGAQGPAATPKP